ncbi:MAG: serine hydrolase [Pseudomonadota bacterium]
MTIIAAIQDIANTFCGHDPGRSIAVFAHDLGNPPIGLNACVPRPLASVIKVAIVMALFDLAAKGRLDLSEAVPVAALGETRYCSIIKAFDQERTLSLREIAALSLITSDNPAMVFLMSRVTFDDIAEIFRAAGCSRYSTCCVGFSEAELGPANRANQMTAEDTVRLFIYLAQQAHYAPLITFLKNNLRNARIPALLPEDAVIAHKTGSLDGVVNDAGIVSRGGRSFIAAFLSEKQNDPLKTQNDIAACTLALFNLLIADKN